MQLVKRSLKNIHPLLDEIDRFYYLVSDGVQKDEGLINVVFDKSLLSLQELFNAQGYNFRFKYIDKHYKPLDLAKNSSKKITVCCSGGKDSNAILKSYKQKRYKVYMYHLKGINKCYPDEYKAVENVAKYLNLELHEDSVKLSGNHAYIEHPMKNMIIANSVLNYAVTNNLPTKICFGNYSTSYLEDNVFNVDAGDCVELWSIYEDIIRTIIPDFKIHIALENIHETQQIIEKDKHLLELSQSCLGTFRFREYQHKQNEAKYNIKLMPHRCGNCWKCATEYIYYTDHDLLEYNKSYYKKCLQTLYNTLLFENNIVYNINEVWNHYMFYDMNISKLRGIEHAVIRGKTIRFNQ